MFVDMYAQEWQACVYQRDLSYLKALENAAPLVFGCVPMAAYNRIAFHAAQLPKSGIVHPAAPYLHEKRTFNVLQQLHIACIYCNLT